MQRGGVDENRSETVLRRLRTIPPLVLGLLLVTALLGAVRALFGATRSWRREPASSGL